jgi:hypothetical protein
MLNNLTTREKKIFYVCLFCLALIVIITCNNPANSIPQAGNLKYTIGSFKDRTDDRLYILGRLTNGNTYNISPIPTIGIYADSASTILIKKYTGVISDENALTPNAVFAYAPTHPRDPPIIHPGEALSHMTYTDPILNIESKEVNAYWYFWWDTGDLSIKRLIRTNKNGLIIDIESIRLKE